MKKVLISLLIALVLMWTTAAVFAKGKGKGKGSGGKGRQTKKVQEKDKSSQADAGKGKSKGKSAEKRTPKAKGKPQTEDTTKQKAKGKAQQKNTPKEKATEEDTEEEAMGKAKAAKGQPNALGGNVMDAGSGHHPGLLGLCIPHTTPRASEIVPYSCQKLPSVPGTFRITDLIDQIPNLLPLCPCGLGHTHSVPKRRRRALQVDGTRPLNLGLNPEDHQESAGRRRQTPSVVIEGQQAFLVREREAFAALRRHTLVVTGAGHEPARRTPHQDAVSRGSLIRGVRATLSTGAYSSVPPTGAPTYYAAGGCASTPTRRAGDAPFPLSKGKRRESAASRRIVEDESPLGN